MTLHDELRELVDTYGRALLDDADQFRAALDDYLPERSALPGQLNVLYDAVRLGAYERCVELLSRGSEPMLAVSTAGDFLARERGTTEVVTSRWAVASLAHATGHLSTDALSAFLQPDTAGGPRQDPTPSAPTPQGTIPSGTTPTGPPPPYPPPDSVAPPLPPTYLPPVETAPGTASPASAQPLTVRLPSGEVALPPPPGTAPDEPRRRSGRTGRVAVAAVAALVAAGVGAYLVVAEGDDDPAGPTAKDSATSGSPGSPGSPSDPPTSQGGTPSAPLAAPDAPTLRAAPAYRSVEFSVKGKVVRQENVLLELRSDRRWTRTEAEFVVRTVAGGQRACAQVRAVRAEGDQRAAGPVARTCGTSKPRTVELVRSAAGCPPDAPESSLACYAYDLGVAGFEPGRAEMRIIGATYQGSFQACERRCTKPVPVGSSGRGRLEGAMHAFDGQTVTVEVDGVRETVQVG